MLIPLSACGAGDSSGSYDQASESYAADDTAAAAQNLPSEDMSYEESAATTPAGYTPESPAAVPANVNNSQALVITATVSMHADDVAAAATGVLDLVTNTGGNVEARNIVNDDVEDGTRGSATMTARVPPDKAETFITELEKIAPVDSVAQDAADVSSQLTDLDIRIENAEASVERIRDLMDKATKIEDLTNLEFELSNRQVALEQLQAQKANLGKDVGMATIYISIRSTADLDTGPVAPSDVSIVGAAKTGWRGFVEVVYSILLVLVTLWPIVVLVVAGLLLFRWRRRRRKNRKGGPDSTPPSNQPIPQGSDLPSPQVS